MVKITNGKETFSVPESSFEDIFKRQGYYELKEKVAEEVVEEEYEEENTEVENVFVEELLEKPIGEWNKKEVKDFAKAKGISLAGTQNVEEAKERIKEFLDK